MNFLLIDTSYLIFYRYYATLRWYSFAFKDDKFDNDYDWSINSTFMEKFKCKFLETILKIKKNYDIPLENIIFCRDCSRKDIWRNKYFDTYKANREYEDNFAGSLIFKTVYQEILPEIIRDKKCKVLKHENLEGDDIIFLTKNYIREKNKENNIIIIANDHDLLQLIDEKTVIINLKEQKLNEKSLGSPELDLEVKIICGDKSDNIPPCFKNCGIKTAIKLINDRGLLKEKFRNNPSSLNTYALNKMIIDLNNIPTELKESCLLEIQELIN